MNSSTNVVQMPPLLHSKKQTAALLSISLRSIDNLIVRKELRPVRIGGRVLISIEELERFIKRNQTSWHAVAA